MADSSALCFSSPFHHPLPSFSSPSSSAKPLPFPRPPPSFSSSSSCSFSSRNFSRNWGSLPCGSKSKDSGGNGGDHYGPYPWEPASSSSSDDHGDIQWVPEDRITLFTAEGLIQIGGSLVPRRFSPGNKRQGKSKVSQRFQRYQESDYMDPNQGLCLGALFDIAATNGLDAGRRLCIFGFCRSIEMLSDVVEDTVLEHGGEVSVKCP